MDTNRRFRRWCGDWLEWRLESNGRPDLAQRYSGRLTQRYSCAVECPCLHTSPPDAGYRNRGFGLLGAELGEKFFPDTGNRARGVLRLQPSTTRSHQGSLSIGDGY